MCVPCGRCGARIYSLAAAISLLSACHHCGDIFTRAWLKAYDFFVKSAWENLLSDVCLCGTRVQTQGIHTIRQCAHESERFGVPIRRTANASARARNKEAYLRSGKQFAFERTASCASVLATTMPDTCRIVVVQRKRYWISHIQCLHIRMYSVLAKVM